MSKLRILREKNNMSRKELSKLSRVLPVTIMNYETGSHDINNARADILYAFAKALNCKIVDLLELEE